MAGVTAIAAAVASCGLLDDDQALPEVARVEIAGTAPVPLEVIVSDDFVRVNDFNQGIRYTTLTSADTLLVQPDFVRDYDISVTRRFLVRVANHAAEAASITLVVSFDGVEEYRQGATLAEGGSLEFSEVFFGT